MAARAPEPEVKEGEKGQPEHPKYAYAQIMSLLSRMPHSGERDAYDEAEHNYPIPSNQNLPDRHRGHILPFGRS